jgi:hypothetical protein
VVDPTAFLGPLGGILAATWGAGAMMGYGFAHKTIGKRVSELRDEMREDKADCARSIADLTSRLREIEDRSFYGLTRQFDQVRASGAQVIGDLSRPTHIVPGDDE